MTRRIAWIAFALALICAIPGWGPLTLFLHVVFPVSFERDAVADLIIPDAFRGGVYEVYGGGILMDDTVHVVYRAANGDRREVLYIADSTDVHTDQIQLSPSPDGLVVMDRGPPPWRLSIASEELGSLGGLDGPLVIIEGQRRGRRGRERVWREGLDPWTWVELIDSAFFLAVWLLLIVGRRLGVAIPPRAEPT